MRTPTLPDPAGIPRIAVLMTCHNRRALTLRCLSGLVGQPLFDPTRLFLVDDGSTDGTAAAVREMVPGAQVIAGDGSLFWNGGMRLAWDSALADPRGHDFYLWLNDDVVLAPDALGRLVADARALVPAGGPVIVAGATAEPGEPETITYGGHRRPDPSRPLRLRLATPNGAPQPINTISGNIVLVSAQAHARLGNLAPEFEHIYGDLDYGLRAERAGVPQWLSGAVLGTCAANPVTGSSLDSDAGCVARLKRQWQEEAKVHRRDWRRMVDRYEHARWRRIAHRLSPYLRIVLGRPTVSGRT